MEATFTVDSSVINTEANLALSIIKKPSKKKKVIHSLIFALLCFFIFNFNTGYLVILVLSILFLAVDALLIGLLWILFYFGLFYFFSEPIKTFYLKWVLSKVKTRGNRQVTIALLEKQFTYETDTRFFKVHWSAITKAVERDERFILYSPAYNTIFSIEKYSDKFTPEESKVWIDLVRLKLKQFNVPTY